MPTFHENLILSRNTIYILCLPSRNGCYCQRTVIETMELIKCRSRDCPPPPLLKYLKAALQNSTPFMLYGDFITYKITALNWDCLTWMKGGRTGFEFGQMIDQMIDRNIIRLSPLAFPCNHFYILDHRKYFEKKERK